MYFLNRKDVFNPSPLRDGKARGQHPARGAAAAARRLRLARRAARPPGAAHRPPADARGLRAGGAARPHAGVPAPAHRRPMRARRAGRPAVRPSGQTFLAVFRENEKNEMFQAF